MDSEQKTRLGELKPADAPANGRNITRYAPEF